MKRNTIIIILFFAMFFNFSSAQKETWNWVLWGNIQISFNNKDTIPQLINGSRLASGWLTPATISDKNGNLLFYSGSEFNSGDRCNIPGAAYNKYNEEIENSIFKTFTACSQNQFILPYPGRINLFYLIKTNRSLNNSGLISFVYDIVDMNKNNGHGSVIKKDTSIGYADKHYDPFIPNGTLFNHRNNIDSWFVAFHDTLNNSWFSSYLFTANNVKDTINNTIRQRPYSFILKRANNNKELAICSHEEGQFIGLMGKTSVVLFSFDNNTGIINEKKAINICDSCQINGMEYSSDNKKLYFRVYKQLKADTLNKIFEINTVILAYDFLLNKSKQVCLIKSLKYDKPTGINSNEDLILAPNGKIYFLSTGDSSLWSIDNPNASLNEIKITENALDLREKKFFDMFPIFLPDYYNVNVLAKSNSPICENETLILNADISDTTYPRSYEWKGPNSFTSTIKSPIIKNVQSKNAGWYILKATVNGAELWDSVLVAVKPLAKPEISGLNKVFEAETKLYKTNHQTNKSNQWSVVGGEIIGYNSLDSVLIKWGNVGIGKVILQQSGSEFDCKGYNEIEVTIGNWPTPNISGKDIVCRGDTVKYSTFYDSNLVNKWTVSNGIIYTETNNEATIIWNNAGAGKIKLVRNNMLTAKIDSTEIIITINELPPKPVITDKGNNNLETNESYLNQWFLNGELIVGETKFYLKAKQSGIYQVIAIDTNGCKSELSDPFDFTVGVDYFSDIKLIIPNPASDYIEISVGAQRAVPDGVVIYDVLGIEVQKSMDSRFRGNDSHFPEARSVRIDVSHLPQGVYFVMVGDVMRKFVKI